MVGHVLPIRMVIALAFLKGIFTRSLPMNWAHGLISLTFIEPVLSARLQPRVAFCWNCDRDLGLVCVHSARTSVLAQAAPVQRLTAIGCP